MLVLGATGVALVFMQQRALTSAIDDALEQRADDLGAVYASGAVPQRLGVGAEHPDDTIADLDQALGQIGKK